MELNKVLSMVRGLVAKAEHESTPPDEAQACRERADALMLKYAIEQATVEMAKPAIDRGKPDSAEFPVADYSGQDSDVAGYVQWLMDKVAAHTRCLVRSYTRYDRGEHVWMSRVYGYESDLRYFEILYTTLRLHMLGVLRPKVDPAMSVDQNAYRLHSAGYNWLEIAGMYGWRKLKPFSMGAARERLGEDVWAKYLEGKCEVWHNGATDEYRTNWQVGSSFKRACAREAKARGEEHVRIAAGGSATYRRSSLQGYVIRIGQRLAETQKSRAAGSGELVLASRAEDLKDYFREANADQYTRCPNCGKLSSSPYTCDRCGHEIAPAPSRECEACKKASSGYCRAHKPRAYKSVPFDDRAYQAGVAHANTADLVTGDRMGSGRKHELG